MQYNAEIDLCELAVQDDCANTYAFSEEGMTVAKHKIDWRWWVTTGLVVLGLGVSATWTISHEFSMLDKHISRVETAVRIIGAKQGGDTKTLVDEALTIAMNDSKAGRINGAKAVLKIANSLLSEQAANHVPTTQQSIQTTFLQYQALKRLPMLQEEAQDGMLKLADYRSTVLPAPPIPKSAYIGESGRVGRFLYFKNSVFIGNNSLSTGPEGSNSKWAVFIGDAAAFEARKA